MYSPPLDQLLPTMHAVVEPLASTLRVFFFGTELGRNTWVHYLATQRTATHWRVRPSMVVVWAALDVPGHFIVRSLKAIGKVEGSAELGVASSRAGAERSHQAHPVVGSGPNIDPLGPSVLKRRLSGLIPSDIRLSIKVYASADFELRVRIAFPDDHVVGS